MNLTLNPDSPLPLYHQIAEALRYRIATGRIRSGEALPSIREAAEQLDVNMHTVRRAYQELARDGLVEMRGARGTVVLGSPAATKPPRGKSDVERFLTRIVREARDRHGLGVAELAHLVLNAQSARSPRPVVHILECSELQCRDHARELEARFHVEARPWCLTQKSEPPRGTLIATFFHYNEIRRRFPERLHEIHFAAIQPDPELPSLLEDHRRGKGRTRLVLCEFDELKTRNIAADLSVLLPEDRFKITPRVVKKAGEALRNPTPRSPVLFAPRVYAALSETERRHRLAFKVPYVFSPAELETLHRKFGWSRISSHAPGLQTVRTP